VQLRAIRKDGDVIWTEHFGTNLLHEESVAAVVVNFRDITGQKRFELILRENEERAQQELAELEHIYHTAPVGLCLIGADLRYLRINERLAAMNGLPADEHLGRTVWEVIPEAARFFAPLLRAHHGVRAAGSGLAVPHRQIGGRRTARPAGQLLSGEGRVRQDRGRSRGGPGDYRTEAGGARAARKRATFPGPDRKQRGWIRAARTPTATCSTAALRFWDTRARNSAAAACST
jgi:PAS domain-containing protein